MVYLVEFCVCSKQYNGITVIRFRGRSNNCTRTHCNFQKKEKLSNQARSGKLFPENYLQSDHSGICNWEITITHNALTEKFLKQTKWYWCHKLKTYTTFGLNERDFYGAYYARWSLHSFDVISIITFCFSPLALFCYSDCYC